MEDIAQSVEERGRSEFGRNQGKVQVLQQQNSARDKVRASSTHADTKSVGRTKILDTLMCNVLRRIP